MRLNKGHVNKVLYWCIQNYGRSKYAPYPHISYKKFKDHEDQDLDGYYEPLENIIYINSDIKKLEELDYLVSTIIEEYTHYKQSDSQYQKLAEKFDYDDHPFEIAAKKLAKKDTKKCISYLRLFYNI
jgi:hypothetical protein